MATTDHAQPDPLAALDHIVFVLYQPQDVVNVGGTARALGNFGFRRLRLVEPAAFDAERIAGIAHQAGPIIAAIERYPDLPAALADCGIVAATTGRPRRFHHPRQSPRAAAPALLAAARPDAPVAILFGREDNGLPTSALDDAHYLLTIPTTPDNHSLNLAQAALLIAYELRLAATSRPAAPAPSPAPPPSRPRWAPPARPCSPPWTPCCAPAAASPANAWPTTWLCCAPCCCVPCRAKTKPPASPTSSAASPPHPPRRRTPRIRTRNQGTDRIRDKKWPGESPSPATVE